MLITIIEVVIGENNIEINWISLIYGNQMHPASFVRRILYPHIQNIYWMSFITADVIFLCTSMFLFNFKFPAYFCIWCEKEEEILKAKRERYTSNFSYKWCWHIDVTLSISVHYGNMLCRLQVCLFRRLSLVLYYSLYTSKMRTHIIKTESPVYITQAYPIDIFERYRVLLSHMYVH